MGASQGKVGLATAGMSNLGAAIQAQSGSAGNPLAKMRARSTNASQPIEQDRQRHGLIATQSTGGAPRMAGDALGEAAKEVASTTAAQTQNNASENSRPMIQGFPDAPVSSGRQESSRDNERDDDKERAKQFLKDKTTGSEHKEGPRSESARQERETQHQDNWQARRQAERQSEDEDRARRSGQQGTAPVTSPSSVSNPRPPVSIPVTSPSSVSNPRPPVSIPVFAF
jgi:hypothetical protein